MSITNVEIKKKSYPVTTPTGLVRGRSRWDVEWLQDDQLRHALFSTQEEAEKYAVSRLGYRR